MALGGFPIDETCWSSSMPKVAKSIGKLNFLIPTKTFSTMVYGCCSLTCLFPINCSSSLASSFFFSSTLVGLGFPPQLSKAQSYILVFPSSPHSIRHKTFLHHKVARFLLHKCNLSLLDFENFDFYRRNPQLSSNPNDSNSA